MGQLHWRLRSPTARIQLVWYFGTLIASTDMHEGNPSSRPGLVLAPAYDMLPMMYAREQGLELPERRFPPLPPSRRSGRPGTRRGRQRSPSGSLRPPIHASAADSARLAPAPQKEIWTKRTAGISSDPSGGNRRRPGASASTLRLKARSRPGSAADYEITRIERSIA